MPATRDEVLAAVGAARDELERIVSSAGEDDWSNEAYEGWTVRQLLAHVASTSGVAGFVLVMARNPEMRMGAEQPSRSGGGFDQDEWNAQQVTMRDGKSPAELLEEARANMGRDLEALAAADDALLTGRFRAPWGIEGTVAEVIIASLREHLSMHVRDLASAVGEGRPR